ncbi:GMC family oxidoreductase [Microcella sp.]|uniref:GMC family oxidoreductase n=1 Tax=Microcella sp. TaxID=1913979 RepID=UPI003F70DA97
MTSAAPDVLVVGAGGSGAPLAARLAARGWRVLLLEAGPVPAPPAMRDGASLAAAMPGHPLAFAYPSRLTAGRDHTVVRGRVAGGSTAINGGYFRRPRAHDLTAWAEAAHDDRWSAAATQPLWANIENDHDVGGRPGHGTTGPMPVTRGDASHPVSAALIVAGVEAGLPLDPDQNASPEGAPGIGLTPTNTLRGERWSTARAYLDTPPASLEVRGDHEVMTVLIEGGRATGVTVRVNGRVENIRADRVVLCGGAIATPQLLVRSGIGPAALLTKAGVPVVQDAPVGVHLHDHPQVAVRFSVPTAVAAHRGETSLGVSAHGSSGVSGDVGDLEVLSVLHPLGRMLGTDPRDGQLSLLISPLRSDGHGTLLLDPRLDGHAPTLDFRYLSTDGDRARLRAAVRLAATLLASDAMRQLGAVPEHPALTALDDADLDVWMGARLSTALHSCGTTPMGTDPTTSVVDGRGAVHGVERLFIADLGILPTTPTSGPAASAVLIGHVIAEALQG